MKTPLTASLPCLFALLAGCATQPPLPQNPRRAFNALEKKLLDRVELHLLHEILAEGAIEAGLEGALYWGPARQLSLLARGSFSYALELASPSRRIWPERRFLRSERVGSECWASLSRGR